MTVEERLDEIDIFDVAIISHGFAPWMRDYVIVFERGGSTEHAGRFRCDFTHCVVANVETRVGDDAWPLSWTDEFIDHSAWLAAGEPDGFVWGANWSLAHPGLTYVASSPLAAAWSKRLDREMHEATLETEAFHLQLIFHDVRCAKLSPDAEIMSRAFTYLREGA